MENKNTVKYNVLIVVLMLFSPFYGTSQIKIRTEPKQLYVADTLRINIENIAKKKGYYNIALQIFERKKWHMMRTDIFNDFPMAMVFQNIDPNSNCNKYYVIDDIFTVAFKKDKQLLGRLVLTYSYSDKLEPKHIIYSEKFIVKAKGN